MTASLLPSIFVPLTGVIMPAVAMAFLFLYIEHEDPTGV
jgi:photosystem I subunit VIII